MKRNVQVLVVALFLMLPASAFGQASRTWISPDGSDSNSCTRALPCATWAGALPNTLAGGEIDALESGAFGGATIDKSVTLDGAGAHAGVITLSDGFVIDNPNAKVVLRRIVMNGGAELNFGPSNNFGVLVNGARVVRLEGMRISDFDKAGVRTAPSNSPARLTISDSVIADNRLNGLSVVRGSTGAANTKNRVTVRNTSLVGNGGSGIGTDANTATAVSVNVFGSLIADNAVDGIQSNGGQSVVRISDTEVTGNLGQGLHSVNRGLLLSWGNNRIGDNAIDGAPTGMLGQK